LAENLHAHTLPGGLSCGLGLIAQQNSKAHKLHFLLFTRRSMLASGFFALPQLTAFEGIFDIKSERKSNFL